MRWAGHVAYMSERRGAYGDLVKNPEERFHPEDTSHSCKDNILKDLQEVISEQTDFIELAQIRDR